MHAFYEEYMMRRIRNPENTLFDTLIHIILVYYREARGGQRFGYRCPIMSLRSAGLARSGLFSTANQTSSRVFFIHAMAAIVH